MPIKTPDFIGVYDLIRRQTEPTFRSLSVVGFHLAHSFLKLHAAGLCYRDINFGNVFLIRHSRYSHRGYRQRRRQPEARKYQRHIRVYAPEVANDLAEPNAAGDRFSLAVLLFFIFVLGHPLKGKRELTLPYLESDPDQSHRLRALDPVFIFDPINDGNRPQPGVHDNPLSFWPIYPGSLRKLFTRAFTADLHDADARVMENEWRKEMCALRDSIFLCPHCGAENFFDLDLLRQKKTLNPCWDADPSCAIRRACGWAQRMDHNS